MTARAVTAKGCGCRRARYGMAAVCDEAVRLWDAVADAYPDLAVRSVTLPDGNRLSVAEGQERRALIGDAKRRYAEAVAAHEAHSTRRL